MAKQEKIEESQPASQSREVDSPVRISDLKAGQEKGDVAKQEIRLPWQAAAETATTQIVGWDNNTGVSQSAAQEVMLKDKSLRHEMKVLKKFLGREGSTSLVPAAGEDPKEGQQTEKKRARREADEKVPDMPSIWKAWYGTMPNLDATQAYKMHLRDEERLAKKRRVGEATQNEDDKTMSMDALALKAEMERMKQDVAEQEALCKDFEMRIKKAEELDKKEDWNALQVSRRLQKFSYKHGVMEGKLRSSETYFEQIFSDTTEDYTRKKLTLSKSYQLMLSELSNCKKEVRGLLEEAREKKKEEARKKKEQKKQEARDKGSESVVPTVPTEDFTEE